MKLYGLIILLMLSVFSLSLSGCLTKPSPPACSEKERVYKQSTLKLNQCYEDKANLRKQLEACHEK